MTDIDATVRTADGHTLAYAVTGNPDGVPLFYFHGIPGSRIDFHHPFNRPAVDSSGVRVIGIDRPGYGGSDFRPHRKYVDWPADASAVADALGIDRFGIIAYSGGGPYAIACALGLGDRVTAVGLVSGGGPAEMPNFRDGMGRTDALMVTIARWAPLIGRLAINQASRQVLRSPEKFSAQFDKELSAPDIAIHREPGMRDAVRAAFVEATRKGPRGIVEDYRIWSAPTGLDYAAVRCPVHIWHGDADELVPMRHAQHVASLIPDAALDVLPGVGHLHTASRWHYFLAACS